MQLQMHKYIWDPAAAGCDSPTIRVRVGYFDKTCRRHAPHDGGPGMATRDRRRWWRGIDWRVVAAVGVPVWYAAGAVVVAHQARASSRPPLLSIPAPVEFSSSPADTADIPTSKGLLGPMTWFTISTVAIDPRLFPGVPVPHQSGPFAAMVIDGGGPAELEPDDRVWRRMGGRQGRAWSGPPASRDGCRTMSTYVPWQGSFEEACVQAKIQGKLVLVVQVSGDVGEEWFVGTHTAAFRNQVLLNRDVADAIAGRFAAAVQKVITVRSPAGPKLNGDVICYFCTPNGRVVHALPGPTTAEAFHREAEWAIQLCHASDAGGWGPESVMRQAIREAHFDRLKREHGPTLPITATPPIEPPHPPSGQLLQHPALAGVNDRGKAHALLAAYPLPTLAELFPVLWVRD